MSSTPQPAQRLDFIDAMRGFAALWVFFYHIWNYFNPWGSSQVSPVAWDPAKPWYYYPLFFLFQYGYYGVTIFFVISGFCIHLPQARRHAQTGNDGLKLEPFFQRRFWRLYPAYFAGLFVASLSLAALRIMEYRAKGWPLPLPDRFWEQVFGVSEIGYNGLFLLPFFEKAKDLNSVLWTLVFEVQFYLLYPLLLWLIRRIGLVPMGLLLLLAEVLLVPSPKNEITYQEHNPWFYFFLAKYFEWFLGVAAAELIVRRQTLMPRFALLLCFLTGIAFSLSCIFVPVLWPYRDIGVATTTFLSLLIVLPGDSTTNRKPGLMMRWFVWVGLFSYSLYLLHIPLLRIVFAGNTLLAEAIHHPGWERWFIFDSIPIVILGSWGFFWIFERPFLKGK